MEKLKKGKKKKKTKKVLLFRVKLEHGIDFVYFQIFIEIEPSIGRLHLYIYSVN